MSELCRPQVVLVVVKSISVEYHENIIRVNFVDMREERGVIGCEKNIITMTLHDIIIKFLILISCDVILTANN